MSFRALSDELRDRVAEDIVDICNQESGSNASKYRDTFIKAARILRDPRSWRDIQTKDITPLTAVEHDDLSREEREVLNSKRDRPSWKGCFTEMGRLLRRRGSGERHVPTGFWHTPKELRTTIITLCVAAVVQGWVQTASNGANVTWPTGAHLGCGTEKGIAWTFAIVNAAPWFSAATFALLVTDPATEILFGRRAALIMAALFTLGSSIGGGLVKNWQQLLICRILLGLGMGCKASVVPVFAAEVAPTRMRGALVMNWQLFDAAGILLGYTANLILSPLAKDSWRYMIASPALPTIILLVLALVACPESPRFLLSRDQYLEAYETFTRLRGSRILAAKDMVYSHYQMRFEQDEGISRSRPRSSSPENGTGGRNIGPQKRIGFWKKLRELFTVRRNRNALVTAVICMISQQLCGVNVLIFYSSNLYSDALVINCGPVTPESLRAPLVKSWGLGLMNFVFSFPAYWLIDTKGRRWLLTTTTPFLCVFMGAAALSFVNGTHPGVLIAFSYLYMVFYSWGLGPVPFTISAEVFPLDHRVVGMSVAVFTNFLGAGLLQLFIPAITVSSLGKGGLLGIFSLLNFIAIIMITYLVRETVTATATDDPNSMEPLALEELYKIFDLTTKDVLRAQTIGGVPVRLARFVRRLWPSIDGNLPLPAEPLWYIWEKKHQKYFEPIQKEAKRVEAGDEIEMREGLNQRHAQGDNSSS